MAKFKKKKSKPTPGASGGKSAGATETDAKNAGAKDAGTKDAVAADSAVSEAETDAGTAGKPEDEPVSPAKEAPETEKPRTERSEQRSKPKERTLTDAESVVSKRKLDKLFWMRIALAVIAGSAATFLFDSLEDPEERRWSSIAFMIIVFIASVFVAKSMRIKLASSDRKKIVTNGLGSYVFLYLFMWIVTYTLVYSAESGSSGIITPIT